LIECLVEHGNKGLLNSGLAFDKSVAKYLGSYLVEDLSKEMGFKLADVR
jgi:hypothetical protein